MPKKIANQQIQVSGEQLQITGLLQLSDAMTAIDAAIAVAEKDTIRVVDFSGVKDSDSTGILLMLRLQRLFNKSVIFRNVPAKLQALLSLSNLNNEIKIV